MRIPWGERGVGVYGMWGCIGCGCGCGCVGCVSIELLGGWVGGCVTSIGWVGF